MIDHDLCSQVSCHKDVIRESSVEACRERLTRCEYPSFLYEACIWSLLLHVRVKCPIKFRMACIHGVSCVLLPSFVSISVR